MKVNTETLPSSLESFISLLISGIYVPKCTQLLIRKLITDADHTRGMSVDMGLDIKPSLPTICTEISKQTTRAHDER